MARFTPPAVRRPFVGLLRGAGILFLQILSAPIAVAYLGYMLLFERRPRR